MKDQLIRMTEGRFAGKYQLIESVLVRPTAYKPFDKSFKEETRKVLVEGQSVDCLAVYTFPISRPGQENANGRVYGVDLWQKVIDLAKGLSFYGLMDHPEGDSDGSTKDKWCVWRNLRFNADKSLVLADAYLFGRWGQDVLDALRAGGDIGLSSVGYGDFGPDGKTIDAESYELDRPADHVLHPSYGVFGTIEDEVKDLPTLTQESQAIAPRAPLKESAPSKGATPMNAREKRQLEIIVEATRKQAESNVDPAKKLTALQEIRSYFDESHQHPTLQAALEEAIGKATEEVAKTYEKGLQHDKVLKESEIVLTQVSESVKALDESRTVLQSSQEHLTQKYETAVDLLSQLKSLALNLREALIHERDMRPHLVSRKAYNKMREHALKARSALVDSMRVSENLQKKLKESDAQTQKLEATLNVLKEAAVKKNLREQTQQQELVTQKTLQAQQAQRVFEASANPEVRSWVDDTLRAFPEFQEARNQLLGYRTMMEAQQAFMRLRHGTKGLAG